MISLPDNLENDYGGGGASGGGSSGGSSSGGSSSGGSSSGSRTDSMTDDEVQDAVNDSLRDSGFVNDADERTATRSPDEGAEVTAVGADPDDSPRLEVTEEIGGRFVGDVFGSLSETGSVAVDTSDPTERGTAAADAIAQGQQVANASFEAVAGTDLFRPVREAREAVNEQVQQARERAGTPLSDSGNSLGLLAVVGVVLAAVAAAVVGGQ